MRKLESLAMFQTPTIQEKISGRPRLDVSRSIIWYEDKVLLMVRKGTHYDGYWELPGGKKEEGFDSYATAGKEIEEETGLKGSYSEEEPRTLILEEETPENQLLHVMKFDKYHPLMRGSKYDQTMVVTHISQARAFSSQVTMDPESHSQFMWVKPEEALSLPEYAEKLTPYTRFALEAVIAQKQKREYPKERMDELPAYEQQVV